MNACGGVSAFLATSPEEVSRRTGGVLRAPFVETLQHRARELGLATRYVPLESGVVLDLGEPRRGSGLIRDLARRLWRWVGAATADRGGGADADVAASEEAEAFEELDGRADVWSMRPTDSPAERQADVAPDPLDRWLQPFLARLRHESQRRWAPVYVRGLSRPTSANASRRWPCDTRRGTCNSSTTSSRRRNGTRRRFGATWRGRRTASPADPGRDWWSRPSG